MTLAAHLDEMIVLYTMDGKTIGQIADRYGASPDAVKLMLCGAGVSMRSRGRPAAGAEKPTRSLSPNAVRTITRIDADDALDLDDANTRHVRAVVRALAGKGFPFLPFGGRS